MDDLLKSLKEKITIPRVVVSLLCSAVIFLGGYVVKGFAKDLEKIETNIEQKVDNETLKQYIDRDKERFEIRQKTVDDKFDTQQKDIDAKLNLILELIKQKDK